MKPSAPPLNLTLGPDHCNNALVQQKQNKEWKRYQGPRKYIPTSTYLYYNHKTNSVKKFSLEVSNWLPVQYSYDMEIFGFSFLDVKLWWYSIFLATIVLRIVATNNLEIGFDIYF